MSVRIKAEQKFGPLTSNGDFWRSKCPECGNKDKSISVHKESGYYHCWHESCETVGYVDGEQNISFDTMEKMIEVPKFNRSTENRKPFKSIDNSDYEKQRELFISNTDKIIKHFKLPWTVDVAQREDLHIGYNKKDKRLVFGIAKNGFLGHIKEHKGPQYGHDKSNKIYPESVLDEADPNQLLFILEGEKDAITALSNEIMGVSFTAGAGAIPQDLSALDSYKNIVICYDADEKGQEGAEKVARALAVISDRKIRIYKWGNVPKGYDITDFFKDGGSREDYIAGLGDAYEFGNKPSDFGGMSTMSIHDFVDIDEQPPENVCEEILLKGGTGCIAGTSNVGKSILALQFAIAVAMGVPFMNFNVPRPRRVYFAQFEMMNSMVRDRLIRIMNAMIDKYPEQRDILSKNLDMNYIEKDLSIFSDKWESLRGNMLSGMRRGPYEVLVVDNLYTSTAVDIFNNEKLKMLLQQIRSIQLEFDLSILMINHHNKQYGENLRLNQDQIRGGKLFTDFLDNAVQVAMSPRGEGLRVLKVTKVRTESQFHEIPIGIHLGSEDDRLMFNWRGPLTGREESWYEQPKDSLDDRVYKECCDYAKDGDIIHTSQFQAILEEITEYTSTRTKHAWLDRFVSHGRFEKIKHGEYKVIKNYLPDLE